MLFIQYFAGLSEPLELVTYDEICNKDNIALLETLVPTVLEGFNNCSMAFEYYDRNNNGVIGFHEAIIATQSYWGFDTESQYYNEKLQQIDCSHCLDNSSLYDLWPYMAETV